MASPSLCGGAVSNRRGLLASLWFFVVCLTAIAFVVALIFTLSAKDDAQEQNYYQEEEAEERQEDPEMAVTSRAMAFAALWTAVLSTLMAIFGTVILGWQSPTGVYYTCCSPQVHKTTPLALGSFIGALIMFSNLTLVSSVLFGEFDIRDYREGEDPEAREDTAVRRSSMAFSIMCLFLTILYASFAGLTFAFSKSILEELAVDQDDEPKTIYSGSGYGGYIGERFDIRRTPGPAFVSAPPDKAII